MTVSKKVTQIAEQYSIKPRTLQAYLDKHGVTVKRFEDDRLLRNCIIANLSGQPLLAAEKLIEKVRVSETKISSLEDEVMVLKADVNELQFTVQELQEANRRCESELKQLKRETVEFHTWCKTAHKEFNRELIELEPFATKSKEYLQSGQGDPIEVTRAKRTTAKYARLAKIIFEFESIKTPNRKELEEVDTQQSDKIDW